MKISSAEKGEEDSAAYIVDLVETNKIKVVDVSGEKDKKKPALNEQELSPLI
jgi:hypothetical protein